MKSLSVAKRLLAVLLLAAFPALLCAQQTLPPVNQALAAQVMRAVALLYSQDAAGGLRMHCTATAFDHKGSTYRFLSAAHCIGEDDIAHEHSAKAENIPFYITFDERKDKVFHPARVVGVGYQHRGDDFSVFEVDTTENWPTIPLGDEGKIDVGKPETAAIINVASPLGLGKQMFRGFVSNIYLDRPIVDEQSGINWTGTMLLQISAGPGSSGSALVSEDQKAIIGTLVGTVGGQSVIGMPVSRFITFLTNVEHKKYPWYAPDVK